MVVAVWDPLVPVIAKANGLAIEVVRLLIVRVLV